jgi:hypothetical protein
VVVPEANVVELGANVILVIGMELADTETDTVADIFDPSVL